VDQWQFALHCQTQQRLPIQWAGLALGWVNGNTVLIANSQTRYVKYWPWSLRVSDAVAPTVPVTPVPSPVLIPALPPYGPERNLCVLAVLRPLLWRAFDSQFGIDSCNECSAFRLNTGVNSVLDRDIVTPTELSHYSTHQWQHYNKEYASYNHLQKISYIIYHYIRYKI